MVGVCITWNRTKIPSISIKELHGDCSILLNHCYIEKQRQVLHFNDKKVQRKLQFKQPALYCRIIIYIYIYYTYSILTTLRMCLILTRWNEIFDSVT